MRIVIVTNYPFPYGLAQTNRIIAMAKGLIHAGAEVDLVVSKATEQAGPKNHEAAGTFEGISFTYATGTPYRPDGKLKRALLYYRGFYMTLQQIANMHKKKEIDALFMGVYGNGFTFLVYLLTRLLKIKYIQERSEYPFLSYPGHVLGRIRLWIYLRFICARFDGFVVISRALENYFRPFLGRDTPRLLMPILVETERFQLADTPSRNVISYCGSMQGTKDGVPILIEAFSKIASQFPSTTLQLIGPTDFDGFSLLQEQINARKLADRVLFTGRVERDEMPALLGASRILALARPAGKQAEGGFPTKLGEYLATGRLVVVTSVGDIPEYLHHQEHALLAEPGNAEDFARLLAVGLTDEKMRTRVGAGGRRWLRMFSIIRFRGINSSSGLLPL